MQAANGFFPAHLSYGIWRIQIQCFTFDV